MPCVTLVAILLIPNPKNQLNHLMTYRMNRHNYQQALLTRIERLNVSIARDENYDRLYRNRAVSCGVSEMECACRSDCSRVRLRSKTDVFRNYIPFIRIFIIWTDDLRENASHN